MKITTLWLAMAAALAGSTLTAQEVTLKFGVPASLTTPRGVIAEKFAEAIEARSQGSVEVEIYPDSQLFPGSGEPKALASGALDLAIPNVAHVGAIEPNADIFSMPMFLGTTPEQLYAVMDGEAGAEIIARVEARLGVKVLGAGFDNGADVLFTAETLPDTLAAFEGLKIRAPGGPKHIARLKALGATPVFIKFEDLALALTQGTVDGVMTNDNGVVQGKLWELGIKHGVDLDLGWAPLMPMVSGAAWSGMNEAQQAAVSDAWAEIQPWAREYIAEEAARLNAEIEANGITMHSLSEADVAAFRDTLMELQPGIASDTGTDEGIMAAAEAALSAPSN
ncbi:TRAP transporter substrate-binding protein DctP [Oceanicola sp. 502str15]|uniref:TRAP transporter substrate-binding protein DctP n=1 Tax=Oceanicola sp. 502str15 TaxID=2696061 RepID=UPI002095A4D3|nr:TRAP transporter substrate-binding protein DctP [Oceanicola sp. 502str15]MCO6383436.1 hypothetical protein [Oceanicola sp. 502str15]